MLMWAGEMMFHPTWSNATSGSFEAWAYRNGYLRRIQRLEQEKWLERSGATRSDRIYRLTESGRLQALGGRDPEACWSRRWDGYWRMIVYDVPEVRKKERDTLRYYLRGRHFGCLQGSVWITPHPVDREKDILGGGDIDVSSLVVLESRPCAGESSAQLVRAAWDFEGLRALHDRYLRVLQRMPEGVADTRSTGEFLAWWREERASWIAVARADPMLPEVLWPVGYAGRKVWQRRRTAMRKSAQFLRRIAEASRAATN